MAGDGVSHGVDGQLWISKTAAAGVPPATDADWMLLDLSTDISYNQQRGEVETTTRRSGLDDEFIPGHANRTADFTMAYDEADLGQKAVFDSLDDGAIHWFRYRPKGTGAGKPERVFKGFVTNAPVSVPMKDKATVAVTIRISGKPDRKLQAA